MRVNANFDQPVVVQSDRLDWMTSPTPGVERRMLDRVGDEVARATSIVRYAPNAVFPEHRHGGGEEILVLEGLFRDETGEFPAGSYIRNPIGTAHAPAAGPEGAIIFVKLHQFDPDDRTSVQVDTRSAPFAPGLVPGLSVLPLHSHGTENTALVRWAPQTRFNPHQHWGGEEILVLDGVFHDEHGAYPAGSWLRSPHLSSHTPFTRDEGALIYVKTGHLGEDTLKPWLDAA